MASWITGSSQEFAVDPIVQSITILGDVIGNSDQTTTELYNIHRLENSVATSIQAPLITLDGTTTADGDLNVNQNLVVSGTINGQTFPPAAPVLKAAQYYKTAVQNLTSGSTDITFDTATPWTNTGGNITHIPGSTDFVVATAGVYQLEFATFILVNGSTFAATNKSISIDITRSPTAEQVILINTFNTTAGLNYSQSVMGTQYLEVGDVINCRVGLTFTGATPQVQCLTNTFDYNTTFTWTLVEASGGGGGGVASVAAGTKISVSGTATNPIINNEGILTAVAGTGILNSGTGQDPIFDNDGVLELTAGTGITLSGTKANYTINATAVSGNTLNINGTTMTASSVAFNETPNVNITATGSQTYEWRLKLPIVPVAGSPGITKTLDATTPFQTFVMTAGTDITFDCSALTGVAQTIYIKNGMDNTGDDVGVKYDDGTGAVAVLGTYSVVHKGTNTTNTPIQILVWNGATMTMY